MDLIPRPVLAFFVDVKYARPMKLLPEGETFNRGFQLRFDPFLWTNTSKWVVSMRDNRNNDLINTQLLPALQQEEHVELKLEKGRYDYEPTQNVWYETRLSLNTMGGYNGTSGVKSYCEENSQYRYSEVRSHMISYLKRKKKAR